MIQFHLDNYTQEILSHGEFKSYIKEALRPKRVLMSLGLVINNEDCPKIPDARKQK